MRFLETRLKEEEERAAKAEQARREAEQAKKEAEQARRESEQARKEAEQAKKEAEHAKKEAEFVSAKASEDYARKLKELETRIPTSAQTTTPSDANIADITVRVFLVAYFSRSLSLKLLLLPCHQAKWRAAEEKATLMQSKIEVAMKGLKQYKADKEKFAKTEEELKKTLEKLKFLEELVGGGPSAVTSTPPPPADLKPYAFRSLFFVIVIISPPPLLIVLSSLRLLCSFPLPQLLPLGRCRPPLARAKTSVKFVKTLSTRSSMNSSLQVLRVTLETKSHHQRKTPPPPFVMQSHRL